MRQYRRDSRQAVRLAIRDAAIEAREEGNALATDPADILVADAAFKAWSAKVARDAAHDAAVDEIGNRAYAQALQDAEDRGIERDSVWYDENCTCVECRPDLYDGSSEYLADIARERDMFAERDASELAAMEMEAHFLAEGRSDF